MRKVSKNDAISKYHLSKGSGHYMELEGRPYVTHAGLLEIATQEGCSGLTVSPVLELCRVSRSRWVFKATVFRRGQAIGFDGFGDADPTNVSATVRGAELRIAETRAVNRALRKAYGIGLCSVEELGSSLPKPNAGARTKFGPQPLTRAKVQPLLRHQLTQLIRDHKLDSELVKRYAADFCGTETLRNASRELIEDFIRKLSEAVNDNKPALLEKLNSYADQERKAA